MTRIEGQNVAIESFLDGQARPLSSMTAVTQSERTGNFAKGNTVRALTGKGFVVLAMP